MTISDIGVKNNSLLCLTNNTQCCRSSDTPPGEGGVGEWYFPNNGSAVGVGGAGGSMYRNRGPSMVRLHRRNSAMMPTGVFHCEIPGASGTISVYVGIYPSQGLGDGEPSPSTTYDNVQLHVYIVCSQVLHRSLLCYWTGTPLP